MCDLLCDVLRRCATIRDDRGGQRDHERPGGTLTPKPVQRRTLLMSAVCARADYNTRRHEVNHRRECEHHIIFQTLPQQSGAYYCG